MTRVCRGAEVSVEVLAYAHLSELQGATKAYQLSIILCSSYSSDGYWYICFLGLVASWEHTTLSEQALQGRSH